MYANQQRPTTARATSTTLQAPWETYFVTYQGAAFIIVWRQSEGTWSIYHEGTRSKAHTLKPVHGLGKEEAIDWIERNF